MDFVDSTSYDVSYFSIKRTRDSNTTDNFELIINGNSFRQLGSLDRYEKVIFDVDPVILADSNGVLELTANIEGNHFGMARLIHYAPVLMGRNASFDVNSISGNAFDITLTNDLSYYSDTFKMFPLSPKYGPLNVTGHPSAVINVSANGNEWIQADTPNDDIDLTITYGPATTFIANESPYDGQINVELDTELSAYLYHLQNAPIIWEIWSDVSGSWQLVADGNLSGGSGNIAASVAGMDQYSTPYNWMVRATDTVSGVWVEKNFTFTTQPDTPPGPAIKWWAIADPHIQTDLPGYRSLENALRDSKYGGDQGGESFEFDFATAAGDWTGNQQCPGDDDGLDIIDQWNGAGEDPSRFYGVIGNHDAGETDNAWFEKWVDPLGQNTAFSMIDNNQRPYPVQGQWDHYSFEVGNILYLMICDRNEGPPPFGRLCSGGYPAGRVTLDTYNWWVDQVESNPNKIIVTVSHQGLHETTIYTGYNEGYDQGIHGGHSWADQKASSMIYAIDNWTIDGLDDTQTFIGERPYGFIKYMSEHSNAIDIWVHSHSHNNMYPGKTFNGRSDVENKYGVTFINTGALTKSHAGPEAPYSRLFEFTEGSDTAVMKTYMHSTGWASVPEGFYEPIERTIPLSTAFTEFEDALKLNVNSGSLYVKPGETVVTDLDVENLLQKVNACQAMLGFDSDYLIAAAGCVVPGGGVWDELIYNSWDISGVAGEIDTAIGVWAQGDIGTDADSTVAVIILTASDIQGTTQLVFRPDDPNDDTKQTFLSTIDAMPVWPEKFNSLDIVIDGNAPVVSDLTVSKHSLLYTPHLLSAVVEISVNAYDELAGLDGPPDINVTNPAALTPVLIDGDGPVYKWRCTIDDLNEVINVLITATDKAGNSEQISTALKFVYINEYTAFCESWLMDGAGMKYDFDNSLLIDSQDYAELAIKWLELVDSNWPD
jgi:hypothetical protein